MGRHSRPEATPDEDAPGLGRVEEDLITEPMPVVDARHRGAGGRSISRGPVIGAVAVVAVTALTFGWFQLRDTVKDEAAQAAATCVDGDTAVAIAADPDVAPALTEIAQRYEATKPVIRDRCVRIEVRSVASGVALTALTTTWDTNRLGSPPAAWVAVDTSFTDRLAATAPAALDGKPASVALSPLVLAVPQDAGTTVTSSNLAWSQVPALQGAPNGWARFGQPDWGRMTVALPTGREGDTRAPQAAQAIAAGLTGGKMPTAATLSTPQVISALTALGRGPASQPVSTDEALADLAKTTTIAGSPFQAVPATEQQVFATARAEPGRVSAAVLDGAAPAADYPYSLLAGPAVDGVQSRAAAAFEEYVMGPDAQQVLADDGFRTSSGTLPDGGADVSFGPLPPTLARTDQKSADALSAALSSPRP